jgi:hypothetical protein
MVLYFSPVGELVLQTIINVASKNDDDITRELLCPNEEIPKVTIVSIDEMCII